MGAPTLGFHSVEPTKNPNIDGILGGVAWNAGTGQNTTTISYSFPTSSASYGTAQGTGAGQYPASYPFTGFSSLRETQVTDVQRAFALISSYTGLTFAQVTEGPTHRGTIRLANTSPTAHPSAVGFFPGSAVTSGDLFFGGTGQNPKIGNFDSSGAVLHEIGHALGLKHGEDPTQPFGALPTDKLDTEFSVMNYSTYIGQNLAAIPFQTAAPGSSPQTFMMCDIAALQRLYGANYGLAGKDVTYTWSPTSGQEFINGVGQGIPVKNPSAPFAPGKIFMTVWTQGANSTYDLSNFNENCYLDMRPGGWMKFSSPQLADIGYASPAYGPKKLFAQGNVYNALLYGPDTRSEIDNLITGNGNDTVYGNDVFNAITLGNGNDVVNCGAGGSEVFAGNGHDTLNGGAGNETFRLTGGTYNVTGGTGTNVLDLTGLTPVNGEPFTIENNGGTGTVSEGTLQRVTFSGITAIEGPDAPTTLVGGTPPTDTGPAIDIAEPPAPASVVAGQSGGGITVAATNATPTMSFIPGGTEVNLDSASPQQSILLQQGEIDQIRGFNPVSDKLDLMQVLSQSNLSLSDLSQAGIYFGVTDSGGNATLSFYPNGLSAGSGAALATLIGVGPNVTLDTLISDGALKIS